MAELTAELNRLAGSTALEATGAANAWAHTTNLELIGALNSVVTVNHPSVITDPSSMLELDGICNALAGTSDLDAQGALSAAVNVPFWRSEGHGTGTSTTISVPVAPAVGGSGIGDLLLLMVGTTGVTPAVTTPSGWTLILSTTGGSGVLNSRLSTYKRIADGTETTLVVTVAAGASVGEMHRVSGASGVNASAGGSVLAAAVVTDPVDVSVTTTVVNCLVFCFLFHAHLTLTQTHTSPASHTERTDFEVNNSGVLYGSETSTRLFAAAGATGTATIDCTEAVATDGTYQRIAVAPA